jgi:hypothetical protein
MPVTKQVSALNANSSIKKDTAIISEAAKKTGSQKESLIQEEASETPAMEAKEKASGKEYPKFNKGKNVLIYILPFYLKLTSKYSLIISIFSQIHYCC